MSARSKSAKDQPQQSLFGFEESVPPAAVTRTIWQVSTLVAELRTLIERHHPEVWVEGEISNCRPAPSGHLYFTLKDAEAQLPVVLFRRQAMLLRFRPADGQRVLARGKLSIYEQRGQMQLIADSLEPSGIGALQLAFEQLKERLRLEGLFSAERKRPLPVYPKKVGIITSPTGAVIRDFLHVARRRAPGLNILLAPVTVQGDNAPAEIESALIQLNRRADIDVIVLARGGGSLEDLAAFNSERVARAIAASGIPTVSAIGHETDFTIADFVADHRAPTPSAAAEIVTTAHQTVSSDLTTLERRMERATRYQILRAQQRFHALPIAHARSQIALFLNRHEQRLDDLAWRLENAAGASLRKRTERVRALTTRLHARDPRRQLAISRARIEQAHTQLTRAMERRLERATAQQQRFHARLTALSPLSVLDRGYALVLGASGQVVRSAAQLAAGDTVTTRLSEGAFTSTVKSTQTSEKKS